MRAPRPTPAELGLDVTVAIVALATPGVFVHVSDRRISFDDILVPSDDGLIKNIVFGDKWSVTFASSDLKYVLPILGEVSSYFAKNIEPSADEMKMYFSNAYSSVTQSEIFNRRISRYGYKSMEDFRQNGRNELGDTFFEITQELNKETLGDTAFIVYGFDKHGAGHLFEVSSSGISDRRIGRYAVIGSGSYLASSSLQLKPMDFEFKTTVYRLLAAKFTAEMASSVGKSTTLTIKRLGDPDRPMFVNSLEKVRDVWSNEMKKPEPKEALDAIAGIASFVDI